MKKKKKEKEKAASTIEWDLRQDLEELRDRGWARHNKVNRGRRVARALRLDELDTLLY